MAVLAPSLIAARNEANAIAPRRRRTSDGWLGDAAHQARESDHNPTSVGGQQMVHALDLSHDPAGGFDAHAHARNIAARHDPRVKYIISNRQIWNPSVSPNWRPYRGTNGHTIHIHISIRPTTAARNDTSPWFGASIPFPTPPTTSPDPVPATNPAPEDGRLEDDQMYLLRTYDGRVWLVFADGSATHVANPGHIPWLEGLIGRKVADAGADAPAPFNSPLISLIWAHYFSGIELGG